MKAVIQLVSHASVKVDKQTVSRINRGLVVLLGVANDDTFRQAKTLAGKIINLRLFSDIHDKINLSVADVSGELLIVSQFTLMADIKKGNRPNFSAAAPARQAEKINLLHN